MAEATGEQVTKEQQEQIEVQTRVKEFVRRQSGGSDSERVQKKLDYFRGLSQEEQSKESKQYREALSSMAKDGVPELMGEAFAVLEGMGQDLDLMTKLSLVNVGLQNRLAKIEERKRLEYQESVSRLPSSATKAQVVREYEEIGARLRELLYPKKDQVQKGLCLMYELVAKGTPAKSSV